MNDQDVIAAFVAHLRANGYPGLQVDGRPDEQNRRTPAIDASAGPFAIEHTSIDTVENQRRDATWFSRVVEPLERQLGPTLSCRLTITLDYHAVAPGSDWNGMAEALRAWIVHRAPDLPDGRHVIKSYS